MSHAPVYQMLGVRDFGGHTIFGRGFNLFKPLRRHFRATPICCQVLSRRGPGKKFVERLGELRQRSALERRVEEATLQRFAIASPFARKSARRGWTRSIERPAPPVGFARRTCRLEPFTCQICSNSPPGVPRARA